jgi:hypothetical protein
MDGENAIQNYIEEKEAEKLKVPAGIHRNLTVNFLGHHVGTFLLSLVEVLVMCSVPPP